LKARKSERMVSVRKESNKDEDLEKKRNGYLKDERLRKGSGVRSNFRGSD